MERENWASNHVIEKWRWILIVDAFYWTCTLFPGLLWPRYGFLKYWLNKWELSTHKSWFQMLSKPQVKLKLDPTWIRSHCFRASQRENLKSIIISAGCYFWFNTVWLNIDSEITLRLTSVRTSIDKIINSYITNKLKLGFLEPKILEITLKGK